MLMLASVCISLNKVFGPLTVEKSGSKFRVREGYSPEAYSSRKHRHSMTS